MTVRLYQDIDGCLNAFLGNRRWNEPDEVGDCGLMSGTAYAFYLHDGTRDLDGKAAKFSMRWNSRLIDALNTLDVEFVWTTTWRQDAVGVGTLMGLAHENVRVLHPLDGKTEFPSIRWKYEAVVAEQQANPSPFIWVDDELFDLPRTARETIHQLGGLIISPSSTYGMTPDDVEKMRKYIAQH